MCERRASTSWQRWLLGACLTGFLVHAQILFVGLYAAGEAHPDNRLSTCAGVRG